ncbi:uncharacterized protein LOC141912030 isoform X2 [Tubulanus polymorphus]|uniref:uncharacterized protein LOC141912030 isoform X2 n=1 Tax=Tubulanus polymorphus TaxID=672921 RepID=UPI003DA3896E
MNVVLSELNLHHLIERFQEENLVELGVHNLGDRVLLIDKCKNPVPREVAMVRGRPKREIPYQSLEYLILHTFTYKEIGIMFNVCERTIAQRVMEFGLRVSNMSDKLSDDILDDIVADAVAIHPNWGEKLHAGHIQSLGLRVQRDRIRESLRRVDPDGIDERKRKTLKRREYWVPGPNFIWHVDGNHKLIRWRIVIHGGIDGFSRIPVFMRCSIIA